MSEIRLIPYWRVTRAKEFVYKEMTLRLSHYASQSAASIDGAYTRFSAMCQLVGHELPLNIFAEVPPLPAFNQVEFMQHILSACSEVLIAAAGRTHLPRPVCTKRTIHRIFHFCIRTLLDEEQCNFGAEEIIILAEMFLGDWFFTRGVRQELPPSVPTLQEINTWTARQTLEARTNGFVPVVESVFLGGSEGANRANNKEVCETFASICMASRGLLNILFLPAIQESDHKQPTWMHKAQDRMCPRCGTGNFECGISILRHIFLESPSSFHHLLAGFDRHSLAVFKAVVDRIAV